MVKSYVIYKYIHIHTYIYISCTCIGRCGQTLKADSTSLFIIVEHQGEGAIERVCHFYGHAAGERRSLQCPFAV